MRIWDISPKKLCRNHLLGEHRELHAIWSILTKNKKGYARHPETLRWKGKLAALYSRHKMLVEELKNRNGKFLPAGAIVMHQRNKRRFYETKSAVARSNRKWTDLLLI